MVPTSDIRFLYIGGCTASGKSALALELAQRLDGEIISVDSMQVYRGLDIGTAKPSREEQEAVKHHLIDVVGLTEAFDAARFVTLADEVVKDIRARGKVPIFCGGTGFYFQAWQGGLSATPKAPAELRAELEATPLEKLVAELQEKDPAMYERVDRSNPRRVIRALEIIRMTGQPVAPTESRVAADKLARIVGIEWDATALRARMDRRVDEMFQRGLVAETEELLKHGLEQNRTAMQAIGYRQVVEHLRGERNLAETIALVKLKTWQFGRRQRTWFKNQLQAEWLAADESSSVERWAETVMNKTE
ncbi:MAG TPA: tRNA (adenosine(37)-N6)-dimethylallyltransferase MiaA [Verrucomicrobiae bacterium]